MPLIGFVTILKLMRAKNLEQAPAVGVNTRRLMANADAAFWASPAANEGDSSSEALCPEQGRDHQAEATAASVAAGVAGPTGKSHMLRMRCCELHVQHWYATAVKKTYMHICRYICIAC